MRIAISPDENPGDPGAVHNGIVERDVNLKVASALEAALKRCGQEAWFDPTITYQDRVRLANQGQFDLLVACAHNAAGSPAAEGALFLFCAGEDAGASSKAFGRQALLAEKVGEALVAGGLVAHFSDYVEDVYECCAFEGDTLYCELGYETNPDDASRIAQPDYPARAAELMAQGIALACGFQYSAVHPVSAPPPEWKANLHQLPAPLIGSLIDSVDVINTVTNEKVETLAAATAVSFAYETRVRDVEYYMTQFAVEHSSGYAIAKAQLHIVVPGTPDPLPDPNEGNKPSNPPATVPPITSPSAPAFSLVDALVNWADHEIIALVEAAIAELKKRAA